MNQLQFLLSTICRYMLTLLIAWIILQ
uniref:Uncharacterized protein n=1 Tax=Arundo donax TaxID=35708 RepID=A0A0A9BVN4_ARUDO